MEKRRQRAWDDFKRWAWSFREWVSFVVPAGLAWDAIYRWGSSGDAWKDAALVFGTGAAGAVLIPSLVFVASFATARGRILGDALMALSERMTREFGEVESRFAAFQPSEFPAFRQQLLQVIQTGEQLRGQSVTSNEEMALWSQNYRWWYDDIAEWLNRAAAGYRAVFVNLVGMRPEVDGDAFDDNHASWIRELDCRIASLRRILESL